MWIVDIALRRPYTFIVMALLLPLFGVLSLLRMPVDIFPRIPIPILSAVWTYNGLSAEEMSARITTLYERGLSTTLNDVEHMESQSLPGTGMVKVFLYPGASVEKAQSQMVSSGQSTSRSMPPGISPPVLISYDASNVPVLQLAVTSWPNTNSTTWPTTRYDSSWLRYKAPRYPGRTAARAGRFWSTWTRPHWPHAA